MKLAEVSHESGLVEDILRGVAQPATLGLEQPLATYFTYKDDIRYDAKDVNGPSVNVTVPGQTSLAFVTPVDRTQPDTGTNKSEMQKFLSLLHDTNNLAICTKDGATVPISMSFLGANISFVYPTDYPSHLLWFAILVFILVRGPGPYSLDALLFRKS